MDDEAIRRRLEARNRHDLAATFYGKTPRKDAR